MKKIIDGKLYDTDTATYIAHREFGTPGDFNHVEETLYQKKTGEFFVCGEGGAMTLYSKGCADGNSCMGGSTIVPECNFPYYYIDVKEWVAECCDTETYIKLFGPVAE